MEELAVNPPDDRAPYARRHPALHIARTGQLAALDALEDVHRDFGCDWERLSGEEVRALLPALKTGSDYIHEALLDQSALKLDTDAMLQGHLRDLRERGSQVVFGAHVHAARRQGDNWVVETSTESYSAPLLVNAAGAWADEVARMAGTEPIGIDPRRRTVIAFPSPDGMPTVNWPFVKTIGEGFYLLPEGSSQLLASPQDEGKSQPCDVAPEEIDIATVAYRIEEASELKIAHITHSWAGLRSFAPDELPVVGHARDAPGFFWFAGHGGYGFQTSPALAEIGEALATTRDWPSKFAERDLDPALFTPERFARARGQGFTSAVPTPQP